MKRYASFRDLLKDQRPSAPALEFFLGERKLELTYDGFLDRIAAFPLPKERVIGIFADTTVETLVALFALIGKKRLVMLSPDDSDEVLIEQIQATKVEALLGPGDFVEDFQPYCAPISPRAGKEILFFTSGTTSRSKAVVLTEQSLCSSAYNGGCLLP